MRSDSPGHELGEFLRARRAAMPAEGRRRRVPGWRREEVASVAGVSVDYLIRLEQGRSAHPSPEVVEALASALQLDEHERSYLRRLAGIESERPVPAEHEPLPPELLDLIELLRTPAFILDEQLDIVAWNGLASRLIHDFDAERIAGRVNLALLTFLNSTFRSAYDDWPAKARTVTAMLRYRLPERPGLRLVVEELLERSTEFAELWDEWRVAEKQRGFAALSHPVGGRLETAFQLLPVAGTRFELSVYTTPTGTGSRCFVDQVAAEQRLDEPSQP